MSSSTDVQKLVLDTLKANASIMALANNVYDDVPANPFGTKTAYISLGPVDTVEDDSDCISGLEITLQIDVWSRAVGTVECKRINDLVRRALHRKPLVLQDNALVDVWVVPTSVRRDPDGTTKHGIVTVTFLVEEAA